MDHIRKLAQDAAKSYAKLTAADNQRIMTNQATGAGLDAAMSAVKKPAAVVKPKPAKALRLKQASGKGQIFKGIGTMFSGAKDIAKGTGSAISKGFGSTASSLGDAASSAFGAARSGSKYIPKKTLASTAALGGGAVAGSDLLQGMAGNWKGDENLNWHRQRMQSGKNWGLNGLGTTLANPVQSLAAWAGGYGNSGPSRIAKTDAMGNLDGFTLSPRWQEQQDKLQRLTNQSKEMQYALSRQKSDLRHQANRLQSGGPVSGYATMADFESAQEIQRQLAELQEQQNAGTYGKTESLLGRLGLPMNDNPGLRSINNQVSLLKKQIPRAPIRPGQEREWEDYFATPEEDNYATQMGFLQDR